MENHSSGDSFWALCPSLSIRLRNLRPYVAAFALMPIKQAADSSVNMIQSVKGPEGASCWGRVSGRPECCSPLAGPLGGLPDGGRGRSGGGGRTHAASVAEPHPPPWGGLHAGCPLEPPAAGSHVACSVLGRREQARWRLPRLCHLEGPALSQALGPERGDLAPLT